MKPPTNPLTPPTAFTTANSVTGNSVDETVASAAEHDDLPSTQPAHRNSVAVPDDPFLHNIDRWKRRALAFASFLALVMAIAVCLMIEAAGLIEVWRLKFGAEHVEPTAPAATRTASCRPPP